MEGGGAPNFWGSHHKEKRERENENIDKRGKEKS